MIEFKKNGGGGTTLEKISLIISIYNKYDFLYLVLKSIENQTFKNFEVILAEDCEKKELLEKLKDWRKEFSFVIKHVCQEDIGFRKCKILNEAIKISSERIVIIDGDCLLHHKFLENYNKYFNKGYDLIYGRRCEMSKTLSEKLLREKRCRVNLLELIFSKSKHWRECIYFPMISGMKKRKLKLLGSNMGFTKEIIYKINGFNEEFESPGVGEDSDLEWRFKEVKAKYIPLKYILVEYHLWHKESGTHSTDKNFEIMEKNRKENNWYTKKGILKI